MKIKKILCSECMTGFYMDDKEAIKGGAKSDGFVYRGEPVTPGFKTIRQPGVAVSVIFVFENGDFAFPNTYYGDYVPTHTIRYSVTPLQVSVKITPFGRRSRLIPYVGGGLGLYFYNLRLTGDLIDFSDAYVYTDTAGVETPVYPISYADTYESQFGRFAFGFQVFGGVMVPIGNRMTLDGGVQYNRAKANLKAFQGFEPLDLGGLMFSIGFNYWF